MFRPNQTNNYLYSPGTDWSDQQGWSWFINDNTINNSSSPAGKGGLQGYAGADVIHGGLGADYLFGYVNPLNAGGADPDADDVGDRLYGDTTTITSTDKVATTRSIPEVATTTLMAVSNGTESLRMSRLACMSI